MLVLMYNEVIVKDNEMNQQIADKILELAKTHIDAGKLPLE